MEYHEGAYGVGIKEMFRFLRNILVHMMSHQFNNEGQMFQWVEKKWPWFWPIFTLATVGKGGPESMRREIFKKYVEIARKKVEEWMREAEWTSKEVELMTIFDKRGALPPFALQKKPTKKEKTEEEGKTLAVNFWSLIEYWGQWGSKQVTNNKLIGEIVGIVRKRNKKMDLDKEFNEEVKGLSGWKERKKNGGFGCKGLWCIRMLKKILAARQREGIQDPKEEFGLNETKDAMGCVSNDGGSISAWVGRIMEKWIGS